MTHGPAKAVDLGIEWVVEGASCEPALLRDVAGIHRFLDAVMSALSLTAACPRVVHRFPGEGGVTALVLLTESHLAIHTFPEHGALTLNLYCCKPRPAFAWDAVLAEFFGARTTTVRELRREVSPSEGGSA
jgi:S-adenosylmethionine decarboxylase